MKKTQINSQVPFSLGIPAMIWQILFFYLPLSLVFFSIFLQMSNSGEIQGISIEKLFIFFSPTYAKVLFSSFLLAVTTTILCFLVAYPLAYFMAFRGKKWKNLLLFLLIIPFWTNFLLHIYAWCFVLEREGFLNTILTTCGLINEPIAFMNSIFATLIMMVYYYLPFMVLPIYSVLEKFDFKLIEASFDLGASFLATFRKVILPMSLSGIQTGFFLVFIPSFGEFAIPEIMGGDRQMFVGNVIAHYILGDASGSLGACFTALSCVILLIITTAVYFLLNRLILPRRSL